MHRLCGVTLFFIGLFSATSAEDSADLRQFMDGDDSRGWEAVGRLDIGGSGMCTGALIAPDLVLTAAHCLYDTEKGRQVDPAAIEFLAGFRHGRASAYRSVRSVVVHPDYVFDSGGRPQVSNDLALLRLERPIDNGSVMPFETAPEPEKGDAVGVVSYAHHRSDAPALQEPCHVLARRFGSIVLSCDVDFGSSGAPVFTIRDGVARIVSVVSAKAEVGERRGALGTTLRQPLETLMREMEALPRSGGTVTIRRIGQESAHNDTGAKFLRP